MKRFLQDRVSLSNLIKKESASIIADSLSLRRFFSGPFGYRFCRPVIPGPCGALLRLVFYNRPNRRCGFLQLAQGCYILVEIATAKIQACNIKRHHKEGNRVAGDHIAGGIGGGFLKKHIELRLHADFYFELLDLFLQIAEANTVPEKINEDDCEGEKGKEKRRAHIRRHAEPTVRFGVGAADHHRVDGAEQADGEERDRRAESAYEGVHR